MLRDHPNVALRNTWSVVSMLTAAYYHVSQYRRLHSCLLIESLRVFNSHQIYEMVPQEEICMTRTARKKAKKPKKKCTISVLHLRSSLLELAAQEELARFYKSFWCSSHHLYQEEEWWSSVLQHDTDSDSSLKREHGTGRLGPGRWLPLNLALVKRKVKNSKLRQCFFVWYILRLTSCPERIYSSMWTCIKTFVRSSKFRRKKKKKMYSLAQREKGAWGRESYWWSEGGREGEIARVSAFVSEYSNINTHIDIASS